MPSRRTSAPRKVGRPRAVDELETTALQRAAVRLAQKRGLAHLSFRALAADTGVAHTTPMHHFGSNAGLLGAIAATALEDLGTRLRRVRESGSPSRRMLKKLALTYAEYGLRNEELYRAIHSRALWEAVTRHRDRRSKRPLTPKREHEAEWVDAARSARDAVFDEFQLAVERATAEGGVRTPSGPHADAAANLLTAIVDGFLFQIFDERVDVGGNAPERLRFLEAMLDCALTGFSVTADL